MTRQRHAPKLDAGASRMGSHAGAWEPEKFKAESLRESKFLEEIWYLKSYFTKFNEFISDKDFGLKTGFLNLTGLLALTFLKVYNLRIVGITLAFV